MSIFRTVSSAATKRLGWPGSRPRRPSLLGWPGVVGRSTSSTSVIEPEAVSRETEAQSPEGVSRETTDESAGEEQSDGDIELVREELAGHRPSISPSPDDRSLSSETPSKVAITEVLSADLDSPEEVTKTEDLADQALLASKSPAESTLPSSELGRRAHASGIEESVGSVELPSTEGEASESLHVASATAAPARSVTVRARGPRRARFDRDEFDNGPGPDETAAARVDRDQSEVGFPAPTQTRIFVVANQKGGVGKTTTSVNLAAALALGGLNVLVLDLDPQGNASTALGIDHGPGVPGTYEVLIEGAAIEDHLVASPEAPHLHVLPATIDLAGAEIQLVSSVARENRLRKALRAYLADHPVDYVFLDCPPSLGLITLNALVAASEILIPIQCEYYALEGVSQLVRTINLVKGELNESLDVSTVLLTMYDGRTRLAAQVAEEVRSYFAEQTLPTVIPRSVRISEAPSYGQTVLTYHPDSAGAVSYLEAAQEIARRGARRDQQ